MIYFILWTDISHDGKALQGRMERLTESQYNNLSTSSQEQLENFIQNCYGVSRLVKRGVFELTPHLVSYEDEHYQILKENGIIDMLVKRELLSNPYDRSECWP